MLVLVKNALWIKIFEKMWLRYENNLKNKEVLKPKFSYFEVISFTNLSGRQHGRNLLSILSPFFSFHHKNILLQKNIIISTMQISILKIVKILHQNLPRQLQISDDENWCAEPVETKIGKIRKLPRKISK